MKNKFAIGIPTLNRNDLLAPSLEKYHNDFRGIDKHIISNGKQYYSPQIRGNNYIWEQDTNIGVAASWNKLCEMIFRDHDWALLVNDDVYLGYDTDLVLEAISNSKVGIVQSAFNWSVVLISKSLYEQVGEFDEMFTPAYYEDSDYMYRLKLMGLLHEIDYTLNPVVVRHSQTYEKNPQLVNLAMNNNRVRYQNKWGGSPLLETYKIPYQGINHQI